jgi:MFS family permease
MNETIWNRPYISILVVNTLNFFSFYITATILSKYLVGIGTTVAMAGFIVGLFALTSLCCRPFSGIMADRLSNVAILKWSNLVIGVGLLGFTVTTNITLLILFRVIIGVGFAFSGTSQIALASKYIPSNKMGEGIGYLGLGMIVGSAVAPGLGVAIADAYGMKSAFLISAALTGIAYILLCFFKDEKKKTTTINKLSFGDIIALKAIPFTLVSSSFSFVNGIVASYLILYADEMKLTGIGIYFTVYAIVLFITRPLAGRLMDKKGIKIVVIPGLILTAISMFMLGRSSTLILILLTAAIRALGQGAGQPALQTGCIGIVGKEKSGVATSTYYLGGDVSQGFGPMIGGFIIQTIAGINGYTTLFDICGALVLCALIYFLYITRKSAVLSNSLK